MRFGAALVLAASAARGVAGHYVFGHLILNGEWTKAFEYVRQVSSPPGYSIPLGYSQPMMDPSNIEVRCGRNGSTLQAPVKTAHIKAGDTIGFGVGPPGVYGDDHPRMFHTGFGSAWLSRSPDGIELDEYTGDGGWVKILMVTGRTEQSINFDDPMWARYRNVPEARWGTYRLDSYNFTIPKTTPAGKYLLRWEHVYPQDKRGTQYYVNCAQVVIANDGVEGTPGPMANIPGHYVMGQPNIYFWSESVGPVDVDTPKPDVWEG